MGKVDLHLHTTASDGRLTPAELVKQAAKQGLTVIAITDHDCVDGVAPALEAAKAFPRLTVIPGVEINTDVPDGEVHVLGYFIDYQNPQLLLSLEELRSSRQRRALKMIDKLAKLGIVIEWQRVKEIAGKGSIGRPHIARAMLEKNYISSIKDAFNNYIGHGCPAYVEREKKTPEEAVQMVLRAKGLPVLAHPFTAEEAEEKISRLKNVGLVGVEAYYNEYTAEQVDQLVSLANKFGLIVTGGSDYHGLDIMEPALGSAAVPIEVAEGLIKLAEERKLKTRS